MIIWGYQLLKSGGLGISRQGSYPVDLTDAVTSPLMFVVGSFLSVYMYTHILLEIYLGKNKCDEYAVTLRQ